MRTPHHPVTVDTNELTRIELKEVSQLIGDELLQQQLVEVLLGVFGDHVWDDSVHDTARRVIKTWKEFASNPEQLPFEFTTFEGGKGQLVAVTDIEFTSICAHHLLPFYGFAHIGYIPHKIKAGLSKFPRLVHHLASRPQVQEMLSEQLVNTLSDLLETRDVMVVLEARHTCMSCRGIRAHTASMTTSLPKGSFFTSEALRNEFLSLINRRKF